MENKDQLPVTVSVIMSVYNGAKYLSECIDSILSQTFRDFEFLITDDCSTDGTADILETYRRLDSRIVLIHNSENLGLTKSLNRMIEAAQGYYIARMDADDVALPQRFSRQVSVFQNEPEADIIFTDNDIIDKDSRFVCRAWRPRSAEQIVKVIPHYSYILHPSVMVRKEFFNQIGLYNEACITGQANELWTRAKNHGAIFRYLDVPLMKYRINPASVRSVQETGYSFKLAKTCLSNHARQSVFQFLRSMEWKDRIQILVRMAIPFHIYRRLLYLNNLRKKRPE